MANNRNYRITGKVFQYFVLIFFGILGRQMEIIDGLFSLNYSCVKHSHRLADYNLHIYHCGFLGCCFVTFVVCLDAK